MTANCPNCEAPIRYLTNGWICEYCGTKAGVEYFDMHTADPYMQICQERINETLRGEALYQKVMEEFRTYQATDSVHRDINYGIMSLQDQIHLAMGSMNCSLMDQKN